MKYKTDNFYKYFLFMRYFDGAVSVKNSHILARQFNLKQLFCLLPQFFHK